MTFIPYNKNLNSQNPMNQENLEDIKKSNLPIIKLSSNEACLDYSEATKKN